VTIGGWIVDVNGVVGCGQWGDELTIDVVFDCWDCVVGDGGQPWCCGG
jgi:hypothetical protein